MMDLNFVTGFEWDEGNLDKSFIKHGISPRESEEVFLDENLVVVGDIKHTQADEPRYVALGKNLQNKLLFVAFTVRKNKIRVILARVAHKKERVVYEKEA